MGFRAKVQQNPHKPAIIMVESAENLSCAVASGDWLNHRGTVGRPLFGALHVVDFIREIPWHATGMSYKRLLRQPYWSNDANQP